MTDKPLFVPLLCNGGGEVKKHFMTAFDFAFAGRHIVRPLPEISGSHPDRGMNHTAKAFLDSPADWWLNIDADIVFTRQDVDHLLSHGPDVPFISGIYPKKQEDTPPCLCTFAELPEPDANGVAIVRRAGRGFTLMHRSLLEAMKEENGGPALRLHHAGQSGTDFTGWNFYQSGPVTGEFSAFGNQTDAAGQPVREWLSEDWMFCERARALGVPCRVDTRIALGHEGAKVYRFNQKQVTRMDSNISSWREIHGWFDYENLYRWLVAEIPDGGRFVEVGCWLGKSVAAFATFAREAGKRIRVEAVDTFAGEPANEVHEAILKVHGGSVYEACDANLKALGLRSDVALIKGTSVSAAHGLFHGAELDAVFIDAAHDYESVNADIRAWRPKVKGGGILAGHDIDEPGVARAVEELLPQYKVCGRCWWVKV